MRHAVEKKYSSCLTYLCLADSSILKAGLIHQVNKELFYNNEGSYVYVV